MLYQVTDIELDFEMDAGIFPPEQTQRLITEDCIGLYEAEDGDDLVEQITNATGWCIKSIDYYTPESAN
jgi:hypothetical protein